MVFCDWITARQEAPALGGPSLHGDLKPYATPDGSVLLRPSPLQVKAKNGSSFRFLYVDGGTQLIDGNLGRFGRLESVLGPDVDQTKAFVQSFCRYLGVPEFAPRRFEGFIQAAGRPKSVESGATITRCDLTSNYALGSPGDAIAWLAARQRFARGRLKLSVIEGVLYFGYFSGHRISKVYEKAADLSAKALPQALDTGEAGAVEYVQDLIRTLRDSGVLRFEVELHRALKGYRLNDWGTLSQPNAEAIYNREFQRMTQGIRAAGLPDFAGIPKEARPALSMYLHGIDVRDFYSRPTFYKYRRMLLPFGYDIAIQAGASAPAPVRDFKLTVPVIPAGYVGAQPFDPELLEAESRDQLEMFRSALARG